jgi:hypothetical protein
MPLREPRPCGVTGGVSSYSIAEGGVVGLNSAPPGLVPGPFAEVSKYGVGSSLASCGNTWSTDRGSAETRLRLLMLRNTAMALARSKASREDW